MEHSLARNPAFDFDSQYNPSLGTRYPRHLTQSKVGVQMQVVGRLPAGPFNPNQSRPDAKFVLTTTLHDDEKFVEIACWSKSSTDTTTLRTVLSFLNANSGRVIMVTATVKNTNPRMYLDNTYYSAYLMNVNGIGQLYAVPDDNQASWPTVAPPQPPLPRQEMEESPHPRQPSKRPSENTSITTSGVGSQQLQSQPAAPAVSVPECDGTCADPDDYAMCSKTGQPHPYPCPLCGGAITQFCLGEKDAKGFRGGPFRGKAHFVAIEEIQTYLRSKDSAPKKPKKN